MIWFRKTNSFIENSIVLVVLFHQTDIIKGSTWRDISNPTYGFVRIITFTGRVVVLFTNGFRDNNQWENGRDEMHF